jgi:hypothetical protein
VAPVSAGQCLEPMVSGEVGWGKQRMRRIGIVALARKLLVELWRLLQTGAFPEGTVTKS